MKRAPAFLLLMALSSSGAVFADEPLGRLFLTPEQRANLDARRKARVPDKPAAPAVVSPTTRLDGFVARSDGRSTVWVNGEALPGGPQPDSPSVAEGGSVLVPVGEAGVRARLKPGEVLDRGTGEVRDVIGRGGMKVRQRD
jgi:hypothetical protein